ncbi:pyridoxamine 5'-phosphate oxidase family protein [Pseudovibrio denitrificans]|uniref:Pyridoxamine 5'-phosphate oxidase family protein n=1 Tax=Pseudovibrio brasiliensis TaxID=1898042 RepID=A0ABX8AN66_9HYPH|nr:pyridoxamine 5'-phosphate oxidase family protein [Pseudovibrio brasiliensis]QUS56008.1 pyridoxamine 5'-phosphate oxidase family protein [Pseudovibrio brasiliensis]
MIKAKRLNRRFRQHIEEQQMFFVATAAATGHINLSPKGMDTLRVLSDERIIWLNLTGIGNETATHVQEDGRMTLMFCSFGEQRLTLRVFGQARVLHPRDADWDKMISLFPDLPGCRQIFDLDIELIQTSCGSTVPRMDLVDTRVEKEFLPYYETMDREELENYWRKHNATSLDGLPTNILEPA